MGVEDLLVSFSRCCACRQEGEQLSLVVISAKKLHAVQKTSVSR